MSSESYLLDATRQVEVCADLDARAFDKHGQLRILPAAEYQRHSQNDISMWCVLRGLYCVPTVELVAALRELLPSTPGRRAIEISAGNGALGRALGVVTTDSHQQERPEVREFYASIGQMVVTYGKDVERLAAEQAIVKYSPAVVLGAWVTHLYRPEDHHRGGNAYGVDERRVLDRVSRYVHVGHERVHERNPMLDLPHRTLRPAGLLSRAMDAERNVIWVWDREAKRGGAEESP